jgi:MYXO-CTERM domain-containing protein
MATATLGGVAGGLPAAGPTPGLEVSAAILFVTLNGPMAPVSVSSNQAEALLCDVTLEAAPGGSWDVIELIFNAGGTGNHNSAYSQLSLYEDVNLSGGWDPADPLAAPSLGGFVANDASFFLTTQLFNPGQDRRFFVIADLNGTAATGDTFNCRLGEVDANSSIAGGSTNGLPMPAATALIIDLPVLGVSNGPNQPDPVVHVAGTAANVVAAQFRLHALNGPVDVTGFTLTTAGTGDWTSDVDATSGVQIYRDNGDGIFSAADALLFQGGGGATVNATFTSVLDLEVGETADLWVIIGLTANAGSGNSAAPETFSVSIANTTDVVATETAVFGTLPPNGITVGAIEFGVATFAPLNDQPAGGASITISGSGFIDPVIVTIGGTPCIGTAVVTGGTSVSGLTVPMGAGTDLEIVIQSGTLPPQTLSQTFTYLKPKEVAPPKNEDSSSCAASTTATWAALLGVLAIGAIAIRRRRA